MVELAVVSVVQSHSGLGIASSSQVQEHVDNLSNKILQDKGFCGDVPLGIFFPACVEIIDLSLNVSRGGKAKTLDCMEVI